MQVTNLGDCGFRVIREGSCIFASDVSSLLPCQLSQQTLAFSSCSRIADTMTWSSFAQSAFSATPL